MNVSISPPSLLYSFPVSSSLITLLIIIHNMIDTAGNLQHRYLVDKNCVNLQYQYCRSTVRLSVNMNYPIAVMRCVLSVASARIQVLHHGQSSIFPTFQSVLSSGASLDRIIQAGRGREGGRQEGLLSTQQSSPVTWPACLPSHSQLEPSNKHKAGPTFQILQRRNSLPGEIFSPLSSGDHSWLREGGREQRQVVLVVRTMFIT